MNKHVIYILICVTALSISGCSNKNAASKNSLVWNVTMDIVKNQLKNPDTAVFCTEDEAKKTRLLDGRYRCEGVVEAANGKGELKKLYFVTTFNCQGQSPDEYVYSDENYEFFEQEPVYSGDFKETFKFTPDMTIEDIRLMERENSLYPSNKLVDEKTGNITYRFGHLDEKHLYTYAPNGLLQSAEYHYPSHTFTDEELVNQYGPATYVIDSICWETTLDQMPCTVKYREYDAVDSLTLTYTENTSVSPVENDDSILKVEHTYIEENPLSLPLFEEDFREKVLPYLDKPFGETDLKGYSSNANVSINGTIISIQFSIGLTKIAGNDVMVSVDYPKDYTDDTKALYLTVRGDLSGRFFTCEDARRCFEELLGKKSISFSGMSFSIELEDNLIMNYYAESDGRNIILISRK